MKFNELKPSMMLEHPDFPISMCVLSISDNKLDGYNLSNMERWSCKDDYWNDMMKNYKTMDRNRFFDELFSYGTIK